MFQGPLPYTRNNNYLLLWKANYVNSALTSGACCKESDTQSAPTPLIKAEPPTPPPLLHFLCLWVILYPAQGTQWQRKKTWIYASTLSGQWTLPNGFHAEGSTSPAPWPRPVPEDGTFSVPSSFTALSTMSLTSSSTRCSCTASKSASVVLSFIENLTWLSRKKGRLYLVMDPETCGNPVIPSQHMAPEPSCAVTSAVSRGQVSITFKHRAVFCFTPFHFQPVSNCLCLYF